MRVIIVDAKNAMFRYGWVHRGLTTSEGRNTGALFGIMMCMARLKKKYPDAKFVLAWDGQESRLHSWRSRIFPEYKQSRTTEQGPSPETVAILSQIDLVTTFASHVGIVQVEVPKIEADDMVGLLAVACRERGWEPIIYSSDQDYLQLLCEGIKVINASSKELALTTDQLVQQKYRCSPENLLKLRSFLGDRSDGIPRAVSGVGEVGAARYLSAGADPSLENFSDHPKSTRRGFRELEAQWSAIHRNYVLMRIPRKVSDLAQYRVPVNKIMDELDLAMDRLSYPVSLRNYAGFVSWLSDLDMSVAVSSRADLWKLQMT